MNQAIEHAERLRQEAIAILIADRDALDAQLARLGYAGETAQKKSRTVTCGKCGGEGHTARACPQSATPST